MIICLFVLLGCYVNNQYQDKHTFNVKLNYEKVLFTRLLYINWEKRVLIIPMGRPINILKCTL